MIVIDPAKKTALDAAKQLCMCDLVTITTLSGVTLRQTLGDADLYIEGQYYDSNLKMVREKTKLVAGVEVDTLAVTIYPEPSNMVGGIPLSQAVRAGILDKASFVLERAFFIPDWSSYQFKVVRFSGTVADIEDFTRSEIPLTINSDLQILNVQMPRDVYQPGCRRVLYGVGCEANKVSFATDAEILAGSTANVLVGELAGPERPFTLGTVVMTSGANVGIARTVKHYAAGVFTLTIPFPQAPAIGDTFTAYAGCDRTLETCAAVFSNEARFSGEPFIPAAETAY